MLGTHLMVSTSKGTIDAHIGGFVLRGSHPYAPAAGQSVKLVGVMTTINHKNVFLTRTIETGNRTVQVRTERGFLIVPGAKGQHQRRPRPREARDESQNPTDRSYHRPRGRSIRMQQPVPNRHDFHAAASQHGN